MGNVNLDVPSDVRALILRVAIRAEDEIFKKQNVKVDRLGLVMDLSAAYANNNKIDFHALLGFPEYDFAHDVTGIMRYLNRETGILEECFVPRSATS